jgi:RNA polymerase sigma-70 factor (ECF subfamily)
MSKTRVTGSGASENARFATTRWTLVVRAAAPDGSESRQALASLCQTYWFPLYAYLRRRGHAKERAEDFTQAFFAHLLEKQALSKVNPERCRFRSFLLASLKNFLADDWRRAQTQKRGGGKRILSLEMGQAETRYSIEPGDHMTAEMLFERSWAMTVIGRGLEKLKSEYRNTDRGPFFDRLKGHMTMEPDASSYAEVAVELGMTEGAVRVAVHRMRQRLRDLIRAEVADTVTTTDQLEEEIRDLFRALGI